MTALAVKCNIGFVLVSDNALRLGVVSVANTVSVVSSEPETASYASPRFPPSTPSDLFYSHRL